MTSRRLLRPIQTCLFLLGIVGLLSVLAGEVGRAQDRSAPGLKPRDGSQPGDLSAVPLDDALDTELEEDESALQPGERIVIVTCSNCGKEVEVTSSMGQRCPHCHILWADPVDLSNTEPVRTLGENSAGGNSARLSAAGDRQFPTPANARAALANADGGARGDARPQQLDVPPPPPSMDGAPQPFGLNSVPLWMKIALFLGSIGAAYYLFIYK